MSQTILSQMLDKLQFLEPVELQQLNYAVQERLTNKEHTAKQVDFHQALVNSGLVQQIKKSSNHPIVRQPIEVQGKPISETIIEERC
ncbi:hypothetical protein [Synechocystis sp. PCC 7509]|uniref:hypothetical protein n=1 Tax=Synechocystis sp. PCC 7509 TaxID=927677 RepID=UPI0002ABE631|nr:hypothetical protein [Synechocystis sp. PCC 7509]